MKKNYFFALFAGLMLLMTMSVNAQVSSMTDLFGKYKFTADIQTTDAGASYAESFKKECEVTIQKDEAGYFLAEIIGFAGADYNMSVSDFYKTDNAFGVNGPNNANYGIWEGYIAVANEAGEWPFAIYGNEESVQYGMTFTFDPESKDITVPDFTIVSLDWATNVATILANVKNVKMELVADESGDVVIPDIAGHWDFEGTLRQDTVAPRGFSIDLTAKDATLKNWDAKFTFEGYEENAITLDATFDGTLLTVPFDNAYLDGEKIRLGNRLAPSTAKQGNMYFSYVSKTAMSLYENIYIRKDTVMLVDGVETAGGSIYQVFSGYVTRENPNAIDWSGVYEVVLPEDGYLEYEYAEENAISFPKTFTMTLEKTPAGYAITEFLGCKYGENNNYSVNYEVIVNDDEVTANVTFAGYNNSMAVLNTMGGEDTNGDGYNDIYYYCDIADGFGEPGKVLMTLNEDGTITFGDFMLIYEVFDYSTYSSTYEALAKMTGAKATKKVFDWAGTYTATATVVEEGGTNNYPGTFDIVVEQAVDGTYLVKEVMGVDVYTLNQGYFALDVAGDGNSATIDVTAFYGTIFLGGSYPDYIIMADAQTGTNPINVVLAADGTLAMDDFTVCAYNYEAFATTKLATYSNVVLTKKVDTAIDNVTVENNVVEGIFDMQGRKIDAITAPGLYIINGKKVFVK